MHSAFRKIMILAASAILVSLLAIPAMAQQRAIRGKVTNEKGEIIVGAPVSIQGMDIKREYTTKTDKKGEYFYMGLPSGLYRVVVRAPGYAPGFEQGIKPGLGQEYPQNFTLSPGDATMKLPFEMSPEEIERLKQDIEKAKKAKEVSGEVKVSFDAGLKLAGEGKFEEAIVEYRKALEKDPDQAYIQANLGDALSKTGKNEEALAAYQKALSLKPEDAALYTNLGVLLGKIGKTQESQEMFKKAASLNPAAAAQNFYNLGATLVNQGQAEQAAEAFRQAIAADPKYAEAYFQLGLCLSGNPATIPDAVKALQKYIEIGGKPDQIETAKLIIQTLQKK